MTRKLWLIALPITMSLTGVMALTWRDRPTPKQTEQDSVVEDPAMARHKASAKAAWNALREMPLMGLQPPSEEPSAESSKAYARVEVLANHYGEMSKEALDEKFEALKAQIEAGGYIDRANADTMSEAQRDEFAELMEQTNAVNIARARKMIAQMRAINDAPGKTTRMQ